MKPKLKITLRTKTSFCDVELDLNDLRLLNGAKWSRRETPADPFEVT